MSIGPDRIKSGTGSLPRITVVTPSFNQGSFLEATLRSVLDQTYANLEYIVLDGGSTDNSVKVIRRYASRLSFWESKKDGGQAEAISRGFSMASGEIMGWVNSDDLLLPGSLARVADYFSCNPDEECVVGGAVVIDSEGNPVRSRAGFYEYSLGSRVTFDQLLFFGCAFCQPACFWRREPYLAVGGFDSSLRFSFDYDLFLRLSRRRPFGWLREYLACFRVHPSSKTSTLRDVRDEENAQLWRKFGKHDIPVGIGAIRRFIHGNIVRYHQWSNRIGTGLGLLKNPLDLISSHAPPKAP